MLYNDIVLFLFFFKVYNIKNMINLAETHTLFFDFDGTLIDHFKAIRRSYKYAIEQLGLSVSDSEIAKKSVSHSLPIAMETFVGKENKEEGIRLFREYALSILLEDLELLPGASWLLQSLYERHFKLAIFTNKTAQLTHTLCKHLNIDPWFETIIGADNAQFYKPNKVFIEHALKTLNACAKTAILIGDSPLDAESAAHVNMPCYIVTSCHEHLEPFSQAQKPTAFFDNLYQLGETLFGLSKPVFSQTL